MQLPQFTVLQHSRLQAVSRVCLQLPSTALESSGGSIHFIISPQTGESTPALVLLNYSPLTKAAVKEHNHYRSQTSFSLFFLFWVVVTNSHLRLLMNINSHFTTECALSREFLIKGNQEFISAAFQELEEKWRGGVYKAGNGWEVEKKWQ